MKEITFFLSVMLGTLCVESEMSHYALTACKEHITYKNHHNLGMCWIECILIISPML